MKRRIYLILSILTVVSIATYFGFQHFNQAKQEPEMVLDFGEEGTEMRRMESKNLSPYAIFGDSSVVLMTEAERTGLNYLEIPNRNKNSQVKRMVVDMRTGMISLIDKEGNVFEQFFMSATNIARFLSVDPHAENYTGWTPYNFVANNPLNIIDPDGRDWVISHNKETNHYTFTFRGQILNETGKEIKDLDKMANEMLAGLAEVFTGKGEGISWSFDMENSYLKVATAESDLSATDHAVRIVSNGTVIAGDRIGGGKAGFGSQAIYLNESILGNREAMQAGKDPQSKNWNARGLTSNGQLLAKYIFAHEAGHTAYLPHITMPQSKVGKDFIPNSYFANYETGNPYTSGKNIMSDYKHSLPLVAPVLTPRQIEVINRRYNAGMLNNGLQRIGTTNPFEPEY
ncbi:hypothetical protein [Thermoflexibacter ruber]|uniref:RHS repeat-associated core domain-containing protein n=1 Tax=Thermoflexibacter ruber TaxID=1003 RepID=A0A1I2JPG7_9BACT|nr:hypothetical protein [Thermoflexibacter ruber]SFF56119.1 RHS repeat-associated core domain-containing protein [Thermoflexibacter ruber]